MQCKFLISFVLMGVCLIQATSAQPLIISGGVSVGLGGSQGGAQAGAQAGAQGEIQGGMQGGLKGFPLAGAIQAVLDILQGVVNNALKTLEELKSRVDAAMKQAIENMQQKLQAIVAKSQQRIQNIIDRAEKAGIDIQTCVADNEKEFANLVKRLLGNEVECVNKEVQTVLRIIKETTELAIGVTNSLRSVPGELQQCLSEDRILSCTLNVYGRLIQMNKDVPEKLTTKIVEITEFVTGIQARLETCAVKQLATAGADTALIVGNVLKCAAQAGLDVANL